MVPNLRRQGGLNPPERSAEQRGGVPREFSRFQDKGIGRAVLTAETAENNTFTGKTRSSGGDRRAKLEKQFGKNNINCTKHKKARE